MPPGDPAPNDLTQRGDPTQVNRPQGKIKLVGVFTPLNGWELNLPRFTLHRGELVVGRGTDNGAVISDTSVSRHHARITREGNEFIIEDLGSRNGTYVDGVSVISCVLRSGDEIQIGRYLFYFDQMVDSVKTDAPQ